jgi:hypothetical protein
LDGTNNSVNTSSFIQQIWYLQNSIDLPHECHSDVDGGLSYHTTKLEFYVRAVSKTSQKPNYLKVVRDIVFAASWTAEKSGLVGGGGWFISV